MKFDIIVIGSGPGGYVAAIRAAQLGLKVLQQARTRPAGHRAGWQAHLDLFRSHDPKAHLPVGGGLCERSGTVAMICPD